MQTGNINIVFKYTNAIDNREIQYNAYFLNMLHIFSILHFDKLRRMSFLQMCYIPSHLAATDKCVLEVHFVFIALIGSIYLKGIWRKYKYAIFKLLHVLQ